MDAFKAFILMLGTVVALTGTTYKRPGLTHQERVEVRELMTEPITTRPAVVPALMEVEVGTPSRQWSF